MTALLAGLAASVSGPGIAQAADAGVPEAAPHVPYTVYRHTFGDWEVVCWRGLVFGRRACFMDAPPIAFESESRRAFVRVAGTPEGARSVRVSARSGEPAGTRVWLRIDENPPHERAPDERDQVLWEGEEAAALIGEMRAGRQLFLRFPEASAARSRQVVSLDRFPEALEAFERTLDALAQSPTGVGAERP